MFFRSNVRVILLDYGLSDSILSKQGFGKWVGGLLRAGTTVFPTPNDEIYLGTGNSRVRRVDLDLGTSRLGLNPTPSERPARYGTRSTDRMTISDVGVSFTGKVWFFPPRVLFAFVETSVWFSTWEQGVHIIHVLITVLTILRWYSVCDWTTQLVKGFIGVTTKKSKHKIETEKWK